MTVKQVQKQSLIMLKKNLAAKANNKKIANRSQKIWWYATFTN